MDSFLFPSSLKVVNVLNAPPHLVVTIQDTREYTCCPSRGQPSRRIHSHSLRVTQDTAVDDRAVEMHLAVCTASLTLVGWRTFGPMLRGILVLTGDGEIRLRTI